MPTRRHLLQGAGLFLASRVAQSEPQDLMVTGKTRLPALKDHPVLKDFARHLIPRAGDIDKPLRLSEVGRLMPWHTHIHTDEVVGAINRMIADCEKGQPVFYAFYADSARAAQTGLFYFRGKPGAPFAVVCPGGGFAYVGSLHEGFPIAQAISERGLNAFVIQYRTGGARPACEDLARALVWIHEHAQELEVVTDGYSLWGGSAGARMAAYLGSYGSQGFGAKATPRARAVIMAYTGHRECTKQDPATYAIVSTDDPIADHETMRARIEQLAAWGIPTQFRLCYTAGHGFGLGTGSDAEGWVNEAIHFWLTQSEDKNANKNIG